MLNLPRKDKDGNSYLSYSAIKAWTEPKGFSTGLLGRTEYIMGYFFNDTFGDDLGFAEFGSDVESYITERKCANKFDAKEKATLEQIQPLGVFQHKFKLQFDGFYLLGYIDDAKPDFSHIRDYKSCSRKSGKKYEEDDYFQLDLYALACKQEFGKLPKRLEVCCIGRSGNPFRGGGRGILKVEDDIWYIERKTDAKRLKALEQTIIKTANEIAQYWEVFNKLNK